jgi:hypothetical protein
MVVQGFRLRSPTSAQMALHGRATPPPASPRPNCAHRVAAGPAKNTKKETRARCPTAGMPAAELHPCAFSAARPSGRNPRAPAASASRRHNEQNVRGAREEEGPPAGGRRHEVALGPWRPLPWRAAVGRRTRHGAVRVRPRRGEAAAMEGSSRPSCPTRSRLRPRAHPLSTSVAAQELPASARRPPASVTCRALVSSR